MSAGLHISDVASRSEWDTAIWAHPRGNIFSSWMWGKYKERCGWTVRRIMVRDDAGDALAFLQCQQRAKGPLRMIYAQGGPLLTDKGERHAEAVVAALLEHLSLGRLDLFAVNFEHFQSASGVLALLAKGFVPIVSRRDHTIEIDLTGGPDAVLKTAEAAWRKGLRRAERNEALSTRFLSDRDERLALFDAFSAMYAKLKERKGFTNTFDSSAYRDLAAADPHHLFLEIRDGGELVLVRIAHLSAGRCTDFFAASTDRARASNAAALSVWRMIERGMAEGCRVFDFGGIDPSGNRGVYDFKRGLSRNVVQSGPLWLFGRSRLLRDATASYRAFL